MAFAYKEPAIAPAGRRALLGIEPGREVVPAPGRLGSGGIVMLLALVLADALAGLLAFYLGTEIYRALDPKGPLASGFGLQLAVLALALPIGCALLGVYQVHGQAPIEGFRPGSRRRASSSHCWSAGTTPTRASSGPLARPS
jgi:hypothetical protein